MSEQSKDRISASLKRRANDRQCPACGKKNAVARLKDETGINYGSKCRFCDWSRAHQLTTKQAVEENHAQMRAMVAAYRPAPDLTRVVAAIEHIDTLCGLMQKSAQVSTGDLQCLRDELRAALAELAAMRGGEK